MNDKPDKDKASRNVEPERDKHPPRAEDVAGKRQKKKPGDAARKMREMFKG